MKALLTVTLSILSLSTAWVMPLKRLPVWTVRRALPSDEDIPKSTQLIIDSSVYSPDPGKYSAIRRSIYEALLPLDRGDFRWEMLVPWTNKTLSQNDKIIVFVTFVGMALTGQQILTPSASVGVHLR